MSEKAAALWDGAFKPPSIPELAFYQRHSKSQSSVHALSPPKLKQLSPTEGKFVIKTQKNPQKITKNPPWQAGTNSEFPNI